jgi:hypothetical protein
LFYNWPYFKGYIHAGETVQSKVFSILLTS